MRRTGLKLANLPWPENGRLASFNRWIGAVQLLLSG
jgi:hypothetical protein